jgi:hypothetical protein
LNALRHEKTYEQKFETQGALRAAQRYIVALAVALCRSRVNG